MPREFVLLQSKGCKWGKCTFCDYHLDRNSSPFETNRLVLSRVTGVYGVLDVINSGLSNRIGFSNHRFNKRYCRRKTYSHALV